MLMLVVTGHVNHHNDGNELDHVDQIAPVKKGHDKEQEEGRNKLLFRGDNGALEGGECARKDPDLKNI